MSGFHEEKGKKASWGRTSLALKEKKECARLKGLWVDLLSKNGSAMAVSALRMRSRQQQEAAFWGASGTLCRHMSGWKRWCDFCMGQNLDPGNFAAPDLALFCELVTAEEPEEGDTDDEGKNAPCDQGFWDSGGASMRSIANALAFVNRRIAVPCVAEAIRDPAVVGYLKSNQLDRPKREAVPLPLAFCVFLENVVLDVKEPLGKRLVAGFFLMCVWASLRFSDLARTEPDALHIDRGWLLRGFCWKTKNRARGRAFGMLGLGFLGGPRPEESWLHMHMWSTREWLSRLNQKDRATVDFCLPACDTTWEIQPLQAMDYALAVARLRSLLREAGIEAPEAYGAHSCKRTLLAWARQLDLREDLRVEQGGHKAANGHCAGLYGGCDVSGPLKLQIEVLIAIRSEGFRPLRAMQRGALPPLPEAEVELPMGPDRGVLLGLVGVHLPAPQAGRKGRRKSRSRPPSLCRKRERRTGTEKVRGTGPNNP